MPIKLQIGLDAISSYRRMAYTAWHAIAEFVDNSTQSYFDHQGEVNPAYVAKNESLLVSIVYDPEAGVLRISDNAMGMSFEELQRALHVAFPPPNITGRSKYGMGLKTAACWMGNKWTVRTKRLGESVEHKVTIDVNRIAAGNNDLPYDAKENRPLDDHYTVVEITEHNRSFYGRTLGKIREYLSSMYREDFRSGVLTLEWQGVPLSWKELDDRLLFAKDGTRYKKEFRFSVDGKQVHGWVGILDKGSRADAGFSIIHCGRVIRGWPESWRPSSLYGQIQGSNDLVNQRLVGEIHLDEFEVTHTKDDIQWFGGQEEEVEKALKVHCSEYREVAKSHRKGADERGPSEVETATAIDELKKELLSPEMVDHIAIEVVPPKSAVDESLDRIKESVTHLHTVTFHAVVAALAVKLYMDAEMSPNDPYVVTDSAREDEVLVIVNTTHPHWGQLKGSDGVLNYLRHCTYDAIAEWQARSKAARIDPDTIKLLKDKLLRVPFELEQHGGEAEAEASDASVSPENA
jgi:hypothetical protein